MRNRLIRWAVLVLGAFAFSSCSGLLVRAVIQPKRPEHSRYYPPSPTVVTPSSIARRSSTFEVKYPPSSKPGELTVGVTYTLWVADLNQPIRGVIVHQHGCGAAACKAGETAARDLQWQALAAKWNCALLGPSYQQKDSDNCRLWCDPRNGSRATFLRSLEDFARLSNHPELRTVPWCFWGHSGGAMWASLMMASDPHRICAVWLRSGTAYARTDDQDLPAFQYPTAAYSIPVMINPGAKEQGDPRFGKLYEACVKMHSDFRTQNAPIGLAVDPKTGHECGDSRALAIPFFDACLEARLPNIVGQPLKAVNFNKGWLAPVSGRPVNAASYNGPKEKTTWLPNEELADSWQFYVQRGTVPDYTPPPPPGKVTVTRGGFTTIAWSCEADLESGLRGFIIEKNGIEIGRVLGPVKNGQPSPYFQGLSYHDTPEAIAMQMTFTIPGPVDFAAVYRVTSLNGKGTPSTPVQAQPR